LEGIGMPFDVLISPARPRRLADILLDLGASPVPTQALAAHKRDQLERLSPSFWHRHHAWLPVGLMGSVACMAMSGGVANGVLPGSLLPSWLCLFWLAVMTLLIVFGVFRVGGGAHWEERCVGAEALLDLGIPAPITGLACRLARAAPGAAFILGELVRDEVVVDPYLLLEYVGETVCLGIWDGRRIIAAAV